MRALTYYVGLSLDGFIAGPGDEVDFYPLADDHIAHMDAEYPEVLPTHVRASLGTADRPNRHFDTIVMGRRTYEPALREGITDPYAHLRTYVCSRTLPDSPDPAVTITDEDPVALVRRLKAEDGPLGVYLAGGGRLAGALLPEIDRLIVKKYPVVAGSGVPAFTTAFSPTAFTLTDSRTFSNGCTVLTLDRA
ncbi:dihydrofolate reductase family protein [Streptomyces chumphonensis]|uniref:Dihydrofolate reductase family protein n=1 Tax=Streptomyces chumphonensis TaxID=1214925 RepID=A0A927IDF4_9ACTN|nr:dihydrofolate reductase family protein [Streptomyces chumphonensis]MBD3933062.1 dihydrofolate reductase family protein [Streptomyces chumphonensis]